MPRNKKSTDESSKNKNLSDAVKAKIDGSKDEAELNGIIAEATKYHVEMVELREGDDGDLQLAGEDLQPAAHLPDLLHAVLGLPVGPHELEVVDHDQAQALVLEAHPVKERLEVVQPLHLVVDVDRELRERVGRRRNTVHDLA